MPLHEYQCARCGRFEVIQKFSDSPLLTCPTCGGEVQKLLSAPAIHFKGTGWYITDYARKSAGSEAAGKGGETAPAAPGAKDGPSSTKDGASSSKDGAATKDATAGASKSAASNEGAAPKGSASGGGSTK